MDPIMQKGGLTPDQKLRRAMYDCLEKKERNPKQVNIIGNDLALQPDCEMLGLLRARGYTVKDLTTCESFEEYLSMAESFFSAGALKKARPGRTRILPERRFCDAAAPGNMPSGYEKRPRNNAASEVFVGSGRHVPEHRFGDLGVGIEIEVAGRGREHTPGREVMAAPVGGVQLFNADGGTCGRAVDEAPFA